MLPFELADFERFEVRRALGSGGAGVVYEALDRESGATVAIKTLYDVTPEALYRLKREFRLLQELDHHNLCKLYELFEHRGRWFITMECVRGEHILQAVRDEQGDYDEARLRDVFMQLADALSALHQAGLVHRDLKPSNVMVEPSGRVVLLDFGFTEIRIDEQTLQKSHVIVGTPLYMAPEQAMVETLGPAADWYSFGVVLFEALTRQLPHDGETAIAVMINKQRHEAPTAASIASTVPPDLDALCTDLLRADPALRPAGAAVLQRLGRRTPRGSGPALAPSHSMPSAFVGRTDELAVLRGALPVLERGRPVSVLVEGPSGVGKTALVRHFVDEVIADGGLVLAGRCYERESVPYKAFDSVIDALARHLRRLPETEVAALLPRYPDLLVRMFPVLGGVPAMNTAPATRMAGVEPHELRNQAFAALREVLHRIANRRRLVITIDDWQWADPDSVLLARDLMRNRDSPPMLLVLTARPTDEDTAGVRLDAIATPDMRHVRLHALVEEQAIQLVGRLQRSFAPSLDLDLAAIARETQGHPLYIAELVRYAATRGSAGGSNQAIRLDEVILARIAELPIEARAILDVLAVAGEPLPFDVLREAVDFEPALVQRHAAMLRVAHLVRSANADGALEPYHDRVSEAVRSSMRDKEKLTWHKRLVHALDGSSLARARPELLLRHLDVAGESSRAAEMAVAAAQRAVIAGAFDQAAGLYGVAVRSGQFAEPRERTLRIEMGRALANAGRGREAAQAFLTAAEGADPPLRMDCHRQAAEELLMVGEIERGLEILNGLLADVGVKMPSTQQRALVSLVWGRLKLRMRGLAWKDRRETEIAPETLLQLDVLKQASHSLAILDPVRAADFNARWLLFALKIGERSRCALALASESAYQSTRGSRGVARGRQLIERVRELAAESRDPQVRGHALMSEGLIDYWACRLALAEPMIREAERIFREEAIGVTSELKSTRMFLTFVLRNRGSWAQLRELRDAYVEDAERRGDQYVVTSMNRYCSLLSLAADDSAEARRVVAEAKWMLPNLAYHTQHWFELEARGEAAIYERTVARDLPELEPLFEGLERSVLLRVTTVSANALWLRGRLALCQDDLEAARRAVTQLQRVDNPRAPIFGTMLEAGIAAHGRDTRAVTKLREASDLADVHHLRLHAAAARYQLGRLLGGTEGADHLAAASRVMAAETVANPARFADWFVPGLSRD